MQGAVSVENFSGLVALSAGLATAAAARPVMSSASPGRLEPLPVDIKNFGRISVQTYNYTIRIFVPPILDKLIKELYDSSLRNNSEKKTHLMGHSQY